MAIPEFSMRQLLEAGVHFGHQSHRWNPKMAEYIFGTRNNTRRTRHARLAAQLHPWRGDRDRHRLRCDLAVRPATARGRRDRTFGVLGRGLERIRCPLRRQLECRRSPQPRQNPCGSPGLGEGASGPAIGIATCLGHGQAAQSKRDGSQHGRQTQGSGTQAETQPPGCPEGSSLRHIRPGQRQTSAAMPPLQACRGKC